MAPTTSAFSGSTIGEKRSITSPSKLTFDQSGVLRDSADWNYYSRDYEWNAYARTSADGSWSASYIPRASLTLVELSTLIASVEDRIPAEAR